MLMRLRINKILLISGVFYIVLSFFVGLITKRSMHYMFAWNMVLSLIPFVLMIYIKDKHQKLSKIENILLLLVFILFFPNTIYFVTDFIHLSSSWFYDGNVANYIVSYENWLSFFHILVGALLGLVMGLLSLSYFENVFIDLSWKYKNLGMNIVFLLTALAIYIGRFLRLNSWDIVNPLKVIVTFINSFSLFYIFFIFLFYVFIMFSYYIFKEICKH